MYKYLFVMRSCGCYGLPEYAIMNMNQVNDMANMCCEHDVDYIVIDLVKAFDVDSKDCVIVSQSVVDKSCESSE